MLYSLGWLNVTNMRRGFCNQTLRRILAIPRQVSHLWEIVNLNQEPMRSVHYNALKLHWRKYTRWTCDSFVYYTTNLNNSMGLHGRGFKDYKDMSDKIKLTIKQMFEHEHFTYCDFIFQGIPDITGRCCFQ